MTSTMPATRTRTAALLALFALPAAVAPAQEPSPALREAIALVEQGDAAAAIALLEKQAAEAALPDIAAAALGALHLEAGNAERALEVLAPLAARERPDPAALFNAGRAAEALGRFQDAAARYRRSIEVEPRSPALRALGMMLGRLGRAGDAYEYLRRWTDAKPNDREARLAAASGAIALQRAADAEELIAGLDQEDPPIKLLRGRVLLLREEPWAALGELRPLAEKPPPALERSIRTSLASAYMLVGEADGAIEQLEGLAPDDPELAGRLARAYYQAGRTGDAISTLGPFVEPWRPAPPPADAPDALKTLARELTYDYGRYLHAADEAERALPFLRLAANLKPELAETHQVIGQVLSALGRRDEAEAAVERYRQLAEARSRRTAPAGAAEPDPDDPVGLALRQAGEGDATGALEALAREEGLAPADPRPAIAASSVLLHAGRAEEALTAVERALGTAPGNPDGLYQRGAVLMSLRRLDEAEGMLRQALAAAPSHVAARSDLAVLLMSEGRTDEAVPHLRRILDIRPGDTLARRHLEQLEGGASEVESLRRAAELDPEHAEAWARLGRALLLEKSFRAAEEPLRRAIELDASNVGLRVALASALWENNRPEEAEREARAAAALQPDDPAPHRLLGAVLLWRGEYLQAAEALDRSASRLAAPDAERLLELARAWEGAAGAHPGRGDDLLRRAETAYRRATELAPEHSEAVYGYAQALRRAGKTQEAAAAMARYETLYERDQRDAMEDGRTSPPGDQPP